MKHSIMLLAATCVLILMDKSLGQSTTSPPVTGSTVGFTGCPSFLNYGGGSQKYRFVDDVNNLPPPQYLPCSGDIDSCVYTAHHDYYCMNGNKPDYTPQLLNPTWPSQPAYLNVTTAAGHFNDGGVNFTTNVGGGQPWISIKLFPNVFARRLVLGGFILKTVKPGYPNENSIFRVGFTDPIEFVGPTYIYFPIGASVTEAFGRSGSVIDQLSFGVITNYVNPVLPPSPQVHSVGGANGDVLFDVTPPPNLNGHCSLVGISGQTSGVPPMYIQGIEFLWSCVGKPQRYV